MSVFRAGDPEKIEAARHRMRHALVLARMASEGQDIALAHLVSVVFRAGRPAD